MRFEIWLGNDPTHFERGTAHRDDGTVEELLAFVNVGNWQDSVLIGPASEFGEVEDLLRWYPKIGLVEPYVWDRNLQEVTFHNNSDHDILIVGRCYLKPGESAVVQRDDERKHHWVYRQMQPIGLARLVSTTHQEDGYSELIGKVGILLSRMSWSEPAKTVLRFILIDVLRDAKLDTEGFETSAGNLEYAEDGQIVFQSQNSEYRFASPYSSLESEV